MTSFASPNAALPARAVPASSGYRVRLAADGAQVRAAQALRFMVFNLELHEGLVRSYETGLDADPFDAVCDHLLVQDAASGTVIGTYRLQTGARSAGALGYYSEREFDFAPYEPIRAELIELGRACIHAEHRNFGVLNLLWKGIAAYARERGARYLIGCSSLTTQDAAVGAAAYAGLQAHLAAPVHRTMPLAAYACPLDVVTAQAPKTPKLLAAYLALGAGICGPPAIDRAFKTIDFLTFVDLHSPALQALQRRWRLGDDHRATQAPQPDHSKYEKVLGRSLGPQ
jgi:putative hemolysin